MVSGAAGFIGSHLCEELIASGHFVYGVDDLSTGNFYNIKHLHADNFIFLHRDVRGLRDWPGEIDWVFHLAARADVVPSIESPEDYHAANVTGTVRMLELARQAKVKRFIYAASSSCYGDNPPVPTHETAEINPKYPYALTKNLGEQYVRHWGEIYKIPTVSLRLFNVYGLN